MACAERIDKTHPMAESFSEAKSTLEKVLRVYKWGRHVKGFPEEVYLLLSRCAYLCFSLWRSDQGSEGGFFHRSPPPPIFWSGLDFGELRGQEPETGALPADSRDVPLTNDTKWFEFWLRVLERSDPRGAPLYQEFSGQILACVGSGHWLDIQTNLRSRKALHLFLQTDQAGRVLLRTIAVLEETIHAILRYFTTLDGRTCVLEKITLLTGVLGEMRQIIVWETPARGPYAPSRDVHWRPWSPWTWLSCDRSQGILTVIPKRDGGEILCTYSPASDAKGRFSWARQVASLKGTYEEALFETWSYDTGEHRRNPQQFRGVTACWTVQYAEAQRLETLSRQVDLLLAALQGNPRCRRLVGAVRGVLRNGTPRWKATTLPWTYVRQLDELLNKLTSIYRQANAAGGGDATEHVVAQIWPAGETAAPEADSGRRPHGPGEEGSRSIAAPDGTYAPGDGESTAPDTDPSTPNELQQFSESSDPFPPEPSAQESSLTVPGGQAEMETPEAEPSGKPELSGEDSTTYSPAPAHQENPVPTVYGEIGRPELPSAADATPFSEPTEADLSTCDGRQQSSGSSDPSAAGPSAQESSPAVPSGQAEVETPEAEPSGKPELPGEDSTTYSPAPVHPENPIPTACGEIGRFEQLPAADATPFSEPAEADPERTAVPALPENPEPKPARARRTRNTSCPEEMAHALVRRLLEHHGPPGKLLKREPLSPMELRRDLGWNPSKVQRALTKVFGPQPSRAYRNKCQDGTISTFLKARVTPPKATGI